MLQNGDNSKDLSVKCSSSEDIAEVEKCVHDTSDVLDAGEAGLPFNDDVFARAIITAAHDDVSYDMFSCDEVKNVVEIKVDSRCSKIMQNSENTEDIIRISLSQVSNSSSENGTVRESISITSHPISQALLSDKEDICNMRLLNGKPPNDEHTLLSKDMDLERGERSDDEPMWDDERGTLSRIKAHYVRRKSRKSVDLGSSDEVKSVDPFESSEKLTQRKSIKINHTRSRSSSLPIARFSSIKPRTSRRKTQDIVHGWRAKSITEPVNSDSSSNLGDVLKDDANIGEPRDQMADAYDMLSTRTDEGNERYSTQQKWVIPARMSIARRGKGELKKKKINTPTSRKFDLEQVTQTSFLPEGENKDPYAEKIAKISEKLAKFLPAEPWPAPSVANSRRRYHQGERSATRSVSSIAPSEDLSTSDIFNSVLVNKISNKHSYLKPRNISRTSRKRRVYRSPLWYEQHLSNPFESREQRPVTRYVDPFDKYNKRDTIRVPQIDESKEDKSWFYPIFSIVGPYI